MIMLNYIENMHEIYQMHKTNFKKLWSVVVQICKILTKDYVWLVWITLKREAWKILARKILLEKNVASTTE